MFEGTQVEPHPVSQSWLEYPVESPGQDHHRHGETEPVDLQVVQTLLC